MAEPHSAPEAAHAGTEAPGAAEHHGPNVFGIEAAGFVSLAMLIVIAVLLIKKVPLAIGRALDSKIALIRDQLAEAEALRKDAETLKAEYEAKAAAAESESAAMIERARHEADEIVANARTDAEALVTRRSRMAEDKIAAEERAAVTQLRAAAADAAVRASARIISERLDADADERLIDRSIGDLAAR